MKRAFAVFVTLFALTAVAGAPSGWFLAGTDPEDYAADVDPNKPKGGSSSALLQSRPGHSPAGFGTLMQTFSASAYAGKRVRMTADVRPQGVERWAGLWMRVDAPERPGVSFDNMQNRPITGTGGWHSYSVVLDVPAESEWISFGVLLAGEGRVWIDNVRFEEVDASVPVTGIRTPVAAGSAPSNLDFEGR